ncbi:MAG: hypothetical protein P8I98_09800 [Nitrospinaceae bacterium]|jgi:hypothetical protein|nr:hypothetical protein [Nitrospina sp.]MBT4259906.1 hypothetical protein [Nitrospina sp.]MBT6295840.1 hypothetical protein [Nitrospina sp.]MDG1844598.1 hypothetical protein [Nitrospinaceae bacterium]
MNFIKLKLDDATYQYLKDRFDGDVNLIEDFIKKMLSKEIKKIRLDPNDLDKKNTSDNLENYLKSGKSGSRSYGVKGQGW